MWHVAQAYMDLARGEMSLAQQEADTALGLVPLDAHGTLAAATIALRRVDRGRAERLLDQLADRARGAGFGAIRARGELLRTELMLDTGRTHEALVVIEALDREHPRVATVKNFLGLARGAVGDMVGAREALEAAARIDPRMDAPHVNLARLARDSGELLAARSHLQRALEIAPDSGEAWLAYGIVLAELHENTARHALVRAAELSPEDAAPYVAQGNLDLADNNLSGAVESYRHALTRNADEPVARTNIGIALVRSGDRAGALEAFEQAARRAPQMGQAWNGLGVLRLQMGNAEQAVGALQQASALLPEDPNPSLNLGLALEALQRWNDAARAFREALRRAPGQAVAMEHLIRLTPPAERERELRRLHEPGLHAHRG